jgi:hypothetical protein
MKLSLIFTSTIVVLTSVQAAQLTVSFDQKYDNASQSVNTLECSESLISRNFTTFKSIPNFPRIGGGPAVTGFDSPGCGTCWELTYVNPQGVPTSINITIVDIASPNYNIALEAMNNLTDNQSTFLGRANVTAVQVAPSACGL